MIQEAQKKIFNPYPEYSALETAHFVAISVPLEKTISYGGGTAEGPQAIIDASQQVELYDCDEGIFPYKAGIATLESPVAFSSARDGIEYAYSATQHVLDIKKIPVILGGEHSLTVGPVRACGEKYPALSILHFDAHGDLRDTYNDNPLSHACALRRCLDIPQVITLVQIGIRNISNDPLDGDELHFMLNNKEKITTWYAKDMRDWDHAAILDKLGEYVYITFDVDALDPSCMPATGTPEPGGMDWQTTIAILKNVCAHRTIIGYDVVEFAPIKGFHAPNFLVAKLIYKIMGFIAQKEHLPI
jgi:agmatinase